MGKMDAVVPEKLSLKSSFKFRCHNGISCFTKCCRNIEIMLTPYDIIRLKKRLGMSSEEFLEKYTYVNIEKDSSHPHVMLMLSDDEDLKCQFLSDEGCSVYSDRPANCRYYPIGQGTHKKENKEGEIVEEEFYFTVKEDHCMGFNENQQWLVETWRKDQEVDLYDKVNRSWKGLQLRKNLPGGAKLDDKKQKQFFMATYNMDQFRRFIFESNFLNVFDIDDETLEKIRESDEELINFGVQYIKYVLMLEESMKLKDGAEQFRKQNEPEK